MELSIHGYGRNPLKLTLVAANRWDQETLFLTTFAGLPTAKEVAGIARVKVLAMSIMLSFPILITREEGTTDDRCTR